MHDRKVDVAIVGAGLAGAAAADVLGRHGAAVLVLDDNLHSGGQYLRGGKLHGKSWPDGVRRRGLRLIDHLPQSSVEIFCRAEVIGIEPGFELLVSRGNGGLSLVKCRRVLLATGARERFIPFKGWTLPGILATGAVQILIKQSGILPAGEMPVGGAGMFLPAVARDIQRSGGRVTAVLNEMPLFERLPSPALLAGNIAKFVKGGAMLAGLMLSGTPFRCCTRIIEAQGDQRLRQVVAVGVDQKGNAIPGSESLYPAGSMAMGFGFAANVELAQLAGCQLTFDPRLGGWVVKVNEDLETSVDGIHAAGEITAIGGAAKSLVEGRIAGFSILKQMGLMKPNGLRREMIALRTDRRRQMAFARFFNSCYTFPPEYMARWIESLADDVQVCRCEGVDLGNVRRAVADGFVTPAGVKKATRCGMGICQGSTCKTILMELISAFTGQPLSFIHPPSVRMPLKPVYLETLAGVAH